MKRRGYKEKETQEQILRASQQNRREEYLALLHTTLDYFI